MYTYLEDGDPNFWTILKNKNWFMRIQINGEIPTNQQREIVKGLIINLEMENK